VTGPSIATERVPTADGTHLHVTRYDGTGHLIVALHGFTGTAESMGELVERVRGDRPAVLIDIVGHGQSDAPSALEPYSMGSVVDQVLSVVGPHQPGTVHLLGYSMGGRVALSIAARAPWFFASVTALSASPGIADPRERQARYDDDHALAERLEKIGLEAFVDEWLSLELFAPYRAAIGDAGVRATRNERCGANPVGLANSLRGTGTGSMPPVWHALPSIRTPLLSVAGALDTKYVHLGRRMAEAAHNGRAEVVEGCGHVVHVENCAAVAALVADFLEVCESDGHLSS